MTAAVDDVHDQRGADTGPAYHGGGVHLVVLGLSKQALGDLVLADHARQHGPHAQLGQGHGLVGALAAEQLAALVHVRGLAGAGHGVDDEHQVPGDLAEHDHIGPAARAGRTGRVLAILVAGSLTVHAS